jgi:hypothetical protein
MAWTSASTPPDKIKSLCEGYHIDNELDHQGFNIYTSETIDLCREDGQPKMAEINSLVSIPSLHLRTVVGVPVVLLDRLDCLLQTETEEK